MKRPWIRLYTEVPNDPKVQRLTPGLFKFWINCLCLCGANDSFLPPVKDVAWTLKMTEKETERNVSSLVSETLLERIGDTYIPHRWDERQYETDVSTERVKRFRERSKKRSETVSVTVIETPSDTEQNRYRSEQTRTEQNGVSSNGYHGHNYEQRDVAAFAEQAVIDSFEEWAEAAYRRHPKKKLKPMALHALLERFARDVPARTTFDENHVLWCATTTWTKEHGSFVPCLGEWIKDDGWLSPPPQPKEIEIEWFPKE